MLQDSSSIEQQNTSNNLSLKNSVLSSLVRHSSDATQWATDFGLEQDSGAIYFALFSAIRSSAKLGLRGQPLFITDNEIRSSSPDFVTEKNQLAGFFTFDDLTRALEDDFLDANRGIANSKREAWKVRLLLFDFALKYAYILLKAHFS